ncbi:L-lactate permease [Saxibacter everestensis]|uniref:L-lactate permease n=1 Tax=Saxibacter everestensis TaxID=2909229 RepID=A0ABY8QSJ3_9MICO|nr:L-lactate permease [Brevibacteriaceae bacterium ZFBP1038]
MFEQLLAPTGSLWWSSFLAIIPLAVLLFLLAGLRWKAQWASLATLAVGLILAVTVWKMPATQAFNASLDGMAQAVLAILWLTFNAIWIHNMSVASGHFEVLRKTFAQLSSDLRIATIIIAFAFGALLEALAGGGAPVAICAVMLISLGLHPIKAVVAALVADTAPVAFGGMGNPITILGRTVQLSDGSTIDPEIFAAMAGRQTSILSVLVPFALLLIIDGKKGVREVWPAALVGGVSFGIAQYLLSNHFSYQLTDIFSALVATLAIVILGRFWQPKNTVSFVGKVPGPVINGGGAGSVDHGPTASADRNHTASGGIDGESGGPGSPNQPSVRGDSQLTATTLKTSPSDPPVLAVTPTERWRAYSPYIIIIGLFSLAQVPAIKEFLATLSVTFAWPGLNVVNAAGNPVNTDYVFNYGSATGTLLFLAGLVTMAVLKISPQQALLVYRGVLKQFGWAIFTILCVFALSYLMNYSGMIVTLGTSLAQTGPFFAFLAPIVGWAGVFITGTDAGANAMFGQLQATAAEQIGTSPVLLGAANTTGGVMGKMISPQNLAVGAAAINMVGKEGEILRHTIKWSLLFLLLTCVLVYLQSTPILGWMVVAH